MSALSRKAGKFEAGLIGRGLEGFQNRASVELQPSGVTELDAVLGGGFPRGSLVELCGPASSGRTSLACSLLAQATERQEACAFVDVSDSLDPMSLAAAGVELPRLLWIRCGEMAGQDPDLKSSSYFAPADKEIRKKPQSRFCEQKASASTWLATSARTDARNRKGHSWSGREAYRVRRVDANPCRRALCWRTGRERQRTSPARHRRSWARTRGKAL